MLGYIIFVMALTVMVLFSVTSASNANSTVHHANDATAAIIGVGILKTISPFSAFALSAAVSVALFPPKTFKETAGLLACCAASYFYLGAFAIDYFDLHRYSAESKDGLKFFCAVPAWMIWQIIAVILVKYRNSKNPLRDIINDVKRAKDLKK